MVFFGFRLFLLLIFVLEVGVIVIDEGVGVIGICCFCILGIVFWRLGDGVVVVGVFFIILSRVL